MRPNQSTQCICKQQFFIFSSLFGLVEVDILYTIENHSGDKVKLHLEHCGHMPSR